MNPIIISKEFIEEILRSPIESVVQSAGSKPGDNYTSDLISIDVKLKDSEEKKQHLIIKVFPRDKDQRKFLVNTLIFKKEIEIYQLWFGELGKIIQNIQIQLPFPPLVAGKFINYEPESNPEIGDLDNYLLMVNVVKSWGFRMSDESIIDGDHCTLVMKELAKMHALSWVYKQREGLKTFRSRFPIFEENMNARSLKPMIQFFHNKSMGVLLKTLEVNLGADSEIFKGFQALSQRDLMEDLFSFVIHKEGPDLEELESFLRVRSFTPEEIEAAEPWTSVNHSDCWANNMLFHYDEGTGKPDKVIILDFQFASEQCPTLDLAFFFYLSTELSTRKRLPEFLRLYHGIYMELLTSFGVTPPKNFEDFDYFCRRFRTSKYFGLISASTWYPNVVGSKEAAVEANAEMFGLEDLPQNHVKDVKEVEPAKGKVAQWLIDLATEFYEDGIV